MPPKASQRSAATSKGITSKPKPKAARKQPLSTSERLKRLFTSLCAQIDGGHFSNAVKTCDKILRLEPQDKDALQTKLFLLLQTEQYNAALALVGSDDTYALEKAYSLYRTNRESEAREALEITRRQKGDDERGALHLEAQLSYREASYQAAHDLYSQLLDTSEPSSDEHADILTNLEAAQKHLDFINTGYLHALDGLPSVTASSLETIPPPQPTTIAAISSASVAEVAPATKERKLRTKRVPKGVVLGVTPPPDPERWLKKSERSAFGQGGKRRKGAGGGATQGVVESLSSTPSATQGSKASGKSKKKK